MASLQNITSLLADNFSINEGTSLAKPLALFILGLAIYAWFIFKFYRFLSRREIFNLMIGQENESRSGFSSFLDGIIYVIKYLFVFPLFLLFWILILTTILAFLARKTPIENILLISVALVGAIRVTAYYDEDLSKDLAKMMPFALLGVFLVDVSYFSISNTLESIKQLFTLWRLAVYYLIILFLIELVMRIVYPVIKSIKKIEQKFIGEED